MKANINEYKKDIHIMIDEVDDLPFIVIIHNFVKKIVLLFRTKKGMN